MVSFIIDRFGCGRLIANEGIWLFVRRVRVHSLPIELEICSTYSEAGTRDEVGCTRFSRAGPGSGNRFTRDLEIWVSLSANVCHGKAQSCLQPLQRFCKYHRRSETVTWIQRDSVSPDTQSSDVVTTPLHSNR